MNRALTNRQQQILAKLQKVNDSTVWGIAIGIVLRSENPKQIIKLIRELKSQAKDNKDGMFRILGFDILQF